MGISEDIRQETSEEIARRLIFDGRVSDEDIAAGCGITPERVQELISEVAHETRELLQELRKMLFDIRKSEISDESRRDILLQIVMLLRLMIDNEVCEEPEQAEIRDYIRYHDAADIRLTLLPIYPESEDYALLYHGQEFVHSFMNSMSLNKIREKAAMDYDQATKTAEKLLRIGTLSYKQISYASGIPLWSIREIQSEMNVERRRMLHVLRKTMLEIGEGIHGAAINEEKLHDQFMNFVETSQALIYGRTITEEEHDDLWEFICDIDGSDLDEFLADFVCGPEDSEVKIMTRAYGVLHSVYAEMLIKHYDAENIMPEDNRDYEEDEPAEDAPGEDWEV